MARKTILISILLLSVTLITGFYKNHDRFMIDNPGPSVFETLNATAATEVALTESLAKKRQDYRQQLDQLQAYYRQTGNVMKSDWVQRELNALLTAPRYRYILRAEIAGANLIAADNIPAANNAYYQARQLYKKATSFFTNKKKLQLALAKFNSIITDYPTSDKIDDAAFMAGRIHERFKDYAIAVLYYKRAFQWNQLTPYPARYRAARILDYKLTEYAEALTLYRASLVYEAELIQDYEEAVELRIKNLEGPLSMDGIE